MVHVLIAEITAKPGKRSEILEKIQVVVKQSHDNEPNTITYKLLESLDNPDKLVVFERYNSKDDLTETHLKSSAFASFRASIGDIVADVKHNHYNETDSGFYTK